MRKEGGFLLIDKPSGPTSFDVVRRMRRIFSCGKVGHAGTLDPQAEGLLICAFGPATRLIRFLSAEPKTYEFTLQFGVQTDSLDGSGRVEKEGGVLPQSGAVKSVVSSFIGSRMQIPPVFSALKIGGRRAYRIVRGGQTPQMTPRKITVHSLNLMEYDERSGRAMFRVECSGGTYVRALARDIAAELGTFGYACSIKRTSCGRFSLDHAHRLEDVNETTVLMSIRQAFSHIPCIQVDLSTICRITYGKNILVSEDLSGTDARMVLVSKDDEIAALCTRVKDNIYHPMLVFFSRQEIKEYEVA